MITHCLPYAGFWSVITDSSAQDDFIFTDGYQFINMTHPKVVYSHFSASIFVFFHNTHKKHISLIALSADKHYEYKTLVLLKTQTSPAATAYLHILLC